MFRTQVTLLHSLLRSGQYLESLVVQPVRRVRHSVMVFLRSDEITLVVYLLAGSRMLSPAANKQRFRIASKLAGRFIHNIASCYNFDFSGAVFRER